ncbi:MAG: glycosyl hydrolase family 28-related protein [Terracidiphilus sp.]
MSHGADRTGVQKSTATFREAIDAAAPANGPATVYVPDGLYVVGNVILKSHVTLYLSGGAVVQASKDAADFSRSFVVGHPGYYG